MVASSKLSVPMAVCALAGVAKADFGGAGFQLSVEDLVDFPSGDGGPTVPADCDAENCNGATLTADQAVGGIQNQINGLIFNFAKFAGTTFTGTCPNYRTINGKCNNNANHSWGATGQVMPRSMTGCAGGANCKTTTDAGIADVYDSNRWTNHGGGINPATSIAWGGNDPREMSHKGCKKSADDWLADGGGAASVPNDAERSDAVITYAQVMDHELDATGPQDCTGQPGCDAGSKYAFGTVNGLQDGTGVAVQGGIQGELKRTHTVADNGITSYVDAGIVYGENDNERSRLRTGGRLKYTCLENINGFMHSSCDVTQQYLPTSHEICGSGSKSCTTNEMFMANPTKRSCFYAGDFRANENPALLAFHTLFARMHNYIDSPPNGAETVAWSDCNCNNNMGNHKFDGSSNNGSSCRFETIRHRVGYEEQYITYAEWLPAYTGTWGNSSYYTKSSQISGNTGAVLTFSGSGGSGGMPGYPQYNPDIQAEVRHVFATATFRQHTGVNHTMKLANGNELELDQTYFESCVWVGNQGPGCSSQHDAVLPNGLTPNPDFTNDSDVTSHGIDHLCDIMAGQAKQLAKKGDTIMLTEQRNQLFYKVSDFGNTRGDPAQDNGESGSSSGFEGIGGDLATLNMFRGRDHNIAGYEDAFNAYFCSASNTCAPAIGSIHTYDGLGDSASINVRKGSIGLDTVYSDLGSVDLWTGALAEAKLRNGGGTGTTVSMLGAILTFDVVTQFRDLRDGDRFFFEHNALSGYGAPAYCNRFDHALQDAGIEAPHGLNAWISATTGARISGNAFAHDANASCEERECVPSGFTSCETQTHFLNNGNGECGSGVDGDNPGYDGAGSGGGGAAGGDDDDDESVTLAPGQEK